MNMAHSGDMVYEFTILKVLVKYLSIFSEVESEVKEA